MDHQSARVLFCVTDSGGEEMNGQGGERCTGILQVLSEDELNDIFQAGLTVLEKTGARVLHRQARSDLKSLGCPVDGETVRVPPELVRDCLIKVPDSYIIYDRLGNPALDLSPGHSWYGSATGSPITQDAVTGEMHPTTVADLEISARVVDALPNIDWAMPMGTSQDSPVQASYLFDFLATVENTTKPIVYLASSELDSEIINRLAAAAVGGEDVLREKPFVVAYPEPITPLVFNREAVERIRQAARWGMPQIPGSSQLIGATSPVTLAGACTLWLAEALMSIVLAQTHRPGSMIFLGGNFNVFDMGTTIHSVGCPEMSLCLAVQAQMGRWLGLPTWGEAGCTDAKIIDAQAGAEAMFHTLAQGLCGLTMIHDVGYMDSAMITSAAMMVLGDEMVGMARRFLRGVEVSPETLATEVIDLVGPGGHFVNQAHTFRHFRREVWFPGLFNRQFYGKWQEQGSRDIKQVVQERLDSIILTHCPQPIPDSRLAEMERIKTDGLAELTKSAG